MSSKIISVQEFENRLQPAPYRPLILVLTIENLEV